jgi:hypothetical protein
MNQNKRFSPTRMISRLSYIGNKARIIIAYGDGHSMPTMCTENRIRVDNVMESPKLAE